MTEREKPNAEGRVAENAAGPHITKEQRDELLRRLNDYRANPQEPLVTLADIRREFAAS